jgi:excisionase family DNA binding protein
LKKKQEILALNESWTEFTLNSNNYTGKIPTIFEMIDDEMLLTPTEVAEIIQVHQETVRRWCRSGKLRILSPVGHYKISGYDLKEFLYQWWRSEN